MLGPVLTEANTLSAQKITKIIGPPISMPTLEVEPVPVGVSVKGHEVIKVESGSQAETLGVKLGWRLMKVAGKAMLDDTKAITAALADARKVCLVGYQFQH